MGKRLSEHYAQNRAALPEVGRHAVEVHGSNSAKYWERNILAYNPNPFGRKIAEAMAIAQKKPSFKGKMGITFLKI